MTKIHNFEVSALKNIEKIGVRIGKSSMCDVKVLTCPKGYRPSREQVLKAIPEYDAFMGITVIDDKFLQEAGSRLKIISTLSVGYNHLDVDAIKKRGIKIGYVGRIATAAVAEIAIFLLIGAARRAHEGRVLLENQRVEKGFLWLLGHDLRNKTVGIVGLGNIGREVVKRLKAFEIKRFVYSGRSRKKEGDELGADFLSLDELLKHSDFVINCLPLTSETEKLFDDNAFKKMKNTSVFVNVGRSKTVDTEALIRALKDQTIFAAGLDVTDPEPLPVDHELLKLSNVVITSHIGNMTVETRTDMALTSVQNILNFFEGKPLLCEI